FAGRFGDVLARHDATVERAAVVRIVLSPVGVFHLHFINAAQIYAAVAILGHTKFERDVEILELALGADIGVRLVLPRLLPGDVAEDAVGDFPAALFAPKSFPAGQVPTIEEPDGCAELHLRHIRRGRHGRNTLAAEGGASARFAVVAARGRGEFQVVPVDPGRNGLGGLLCHGLPIGPWLSRLVHACEDEGAVLDLGAGHGQHAAAAPEDAGLDLPARFRDAQPPGATTGDG